MQPEDRKNGTHAKNDWLDDSERAILEEMEADARYFAQDASPGGAAA